MSTVIDTDMQHAVEDAAAPVDIDAHANSLYHQTTAQDRLKEIFARL
jgi:hypothetical protein